MKTFVSAGGTVFLSAAHLDRRVDRSRPPTLTGETLQKEIFGLVIKPGINRITAIQVPETEDLPGLRLDYVLRGGPHGVPVAELLDARPLAFAGAIPVLVRKTIGSGSMYLLLSSEYPGAKAWERFLRDTFRALSARALRTETVSVDGSPTLNWALYPEVGTRPQTLHLLEYDARTDEYPACNKRFKLPSCTVQGRIPRNACRITVAGRRFELELAVNTLRTAYVCGDLALSPDDPRVALVRHRHRGGRHVFTFRGAGSTELTLVTLGDGVLNIETPGVTVRRGAGRKRCNWSCRIDVRSGTETELVCSVRRHSKRCV